MNRQKIILAAVVLALVGATVAVLARTKSHQKLGEPGVKTRPIAGSKNLEIMLPETVPGYTSEISTNGESALTVLPPDTSYRVRLYKAEDGFMSQMSVVLMGSDRSSIHHPQICLTAQGWAIDNQLTRVDRIHFDQPVAYDLPVNKLTTTIQFKDAGGQVQTMRGLYVYWYVDGDTYTASSQEWMLWRLPRDLLFNGLLERWSYISFWSSCRPGQEDATYERMKKLMVMTVPEFQRVPRAGK